MNVPRCNSERLWQTLMDMARIGATPAGGCNRQTLTEEDRQGRELFVEWCEAAGCEVRTDAIGNLFARRPGTDPDAPSILVGSHLDTQPTGGKYDGVYGVLAGLEVVRSLNDLGVATRSPVDVAVWTNEEGVRFAPAMMGSGVWAGEFDLAATHAIEDRNGVSVADALKNIGALGDEPAAPFPVKGALEIHIEQGPILEAEGRQIGVVTGVQGIRWYDLTFTGDACHAGPTPMEARRDPMAALRDFLSRAYDIALDNAPWGRITFGDLTVSPGSRNTVPESVRLAIDIRHPEQATLDAMDARLRELAAQLNDGRISTELADVWHSPAVDFDPACIDAVRSTADRLERPAMDMVSGAGHDSVYVSRVAPTAMIFIPCKDGLSHNEAESATREDVGAGCDVLLGAVLELDARD
jgi:N-carbamoyl-L-amino-acid hydrolase